jgi:CBS domain-containing protein
MKPLGELTVADLMTGEPICASRTEKLSDAIQRFADSGVSAMPVVDDDQRIVGILSLVDLLEFTRELHSDISSMTLVSGKTRSFLLKLLVDDEAKTSVDDVMTQAVETVWPDTNAVVAAKVMLDGGFRHLPVIDQDGCALGILSTTDFVRAFAEQAPLLAG